jgi:tRNA-specific 2-thiouridylase
MKKRVVIGLSGGVDSSVAAYLLQQQGYEVIGIFMKNWHDETVTLSNECPWIDDSNDALLVAEKLGIPFQSIDMSSEYHARVVDYMFDEYKKGRTPNPDVLCNREIKFDIFLKTALDLGADYVATGHYCQKKQFQHQNQTMYQLIGGADANKDQSYFLCQLSQYQLSKALFPIGHLQKSEVRRIATEQQLVTANKKDSQGICFVGKVSLPIFLQQKLATKQGDVIEIAADSPVFSSNSQPTFAQVCAPHTLLPQHGKLRGTHNGAHFYTIGQRKGLHIGGSLLPLFVLATDVQNNIIYVGQGEDHPGLLRQGLRIAPNEIHWLRTDLTLPTNQTARYNVRIRYRQPLVPATLYQTLEGLYIVFDDPQRSIAAGQFAAWYTADNELIGSGVIGD